MNLFALVNPYPANSAKAAEWDRVIHQAKEVIEAGQAAGRAAIEPKLNVQPSMQCPFCRRLTEAAMINEAGDVVYRCSSSKHNGVRAWRRSMDGQLYRGERSKIRATV